MAMPSDTPPATRHDAPPLWNDATGRTWAEMQPLLDAMLQPLADALMREVAARRPRALLDIGCGAGATTLAAARLLGPGAACTGVDVSAPLVAAARERAAREGVPARFVLADAQRHAFDPGAHDMLVSRMGVMFFDDPVQAFANLRDAAAPGAALRCIAWRGAQENPFMTAAERAAAPLLPQLPARDPDAPGQFAFGDADRVRRMLDASGWSGVVLRPVDAECGFPASELPRYVARLGPVGRVLQQLPEAGRGPVLDAVLAAFAPYVRGGAVRFTAACWMLEAVRP